MNRYKYRRIAHTTESFFTKEAIMSFSTTLPNPTPEQSIGPYMQSFAAKNNTTMCFIFHASY
jgi:hypothetical protein